jgi:diguanylate cyclase (GGDEF)-like protein
MDNLVLQALSERFPREARAEMPDLSAPEIWLRDLRDNIDFAFQPIVNIYTGSCYGVEALLRGHEGLGFDKISDVFDYAHHNGILHQTELTLKEMSISKFAKLKIDQFVRLFLNIDNRVLDSADYRPGQTGRLLKKHGLSLRSICLEISERHELASGGNTSKILEQYSERPFKLALDDFGTGYAGLKVLYDYHPDFIKIDRYFINNIHIKEKKKLFLSNIVSLAHVLGITVVAEGVETEREFLTCKEIGCDLLQGYFVQKPVVELNKLNSNYSQISTLNSRDRRAAGDDREIIDEEIKNLPALDFNTPMGEVFEIFRRNKHLTFFPVIDENKEPLGLVCENNLKDYTYSVFGKELILNKAYSKTLMDFVSTCPVADIRMGAEKIIEIFSRSKNPDGIIISDSFRYVGFLSALSLLRVINEKNLTYARDQNPLSKLPGNSVISDYVTQVLKDVNRSMTMIYFDFDNFKPFNDYYGYRQGDRAIVLFAELMRKELGRQENFLGHVGGDDFFAGVEGGTFEETEEEVRKLKELFAHDVESFYDAKAREEGGIRARSRGGRQAFFPMLTVSAAIIHIPAGRPPCSLDEISRLIAQVKKQSKSSDTGISVVSLACCLSKTGS